MEVGFVESATELALEVVPIGTFEAERIGPDLRQLLLDNGARRAEPLRVAAPRPGRRPADLISTAGFAVALVGTLVQVIDAVRGWVAGHRTQGVTAIRVTIGQDEITVNHPSTRSEDALVEDFIRRHAKS
jgi:hypothetical protein